MKLVIFTAPAILCAIIVFPALLSSAHKEHNWPQALLCAFLPGCFVLVAAVLIRMNRDLSRLRRRIARLEGKAAPAQPPSSLRSADSADSLKIAGDD
jgi:chromate transport protein ChrA